MSIVPVFLVTLLVTLLLFLALVFGRTPSYRPTRESTIQLLDALLEGKASIPAWDLFLGTPILSDALLEEVRVDCVNLHEGLNGVPKAREGIDGFIYDRKGRERIKTILCQLHKKIDAEPVTREF